MKKCGGTGLISDKTKALYAEVARDRAETAASSYSKTEYNIYSVIVTKNHQKIQSRCLVHEFSFTDIFLTILIIVTELLY